MSSIAFTGGPLDGMSGMDPAAPLPEEAPEESEGEIFKRVLSDVRALLSLDTVSEQNKLLLEKATTLIQQIKASEEKDMDSAMGGKLNPGVLRKLGGGAA